MSIFNRIRQLKDELKSVVSKQSLIPFAGDRGPTVGAATIFDKIKNLKSEMSNLRNYSR